MLWCEGPVPQLAHTGTHMHSRRSKRDWLDYQGWPDGVTGSDQGWPDGVTGSDQG